MVNATSYYYKIYNLNIKSQILLDEFCNFEYSSLPFIDVDIVLDVCPTSIHNIKHSNFFCTCNDHEGIFSCKNIGDFYVSNGNKIVISPLEDANFVDLRAYIYFRAFSILLFQRNIVALHSNSIVINNKVVAICGTSGSGKSTLSTALTLKGYPLLSDDLSAINLYENRPMICSGLSSSRLCIDTINYFNLDKDSLVQVDTIANKYSLQPKSIISKDLYDLAIIIELNINPDSSSKCELVELKGHDKLQTIFNNIFMKSLPSDLGFSPSYIKTCINTAKYTRIFRLTRPADKFTINDQVNLIENII